MMSCIWSGDVRNDIYVTVESGVFEKGTKRAERNVEVAIEVYDGSNHVIPVRPLGLVFELDDPYQHWHVPITVESPNADTFGTYM